MALHEEAGAGGRQSRSGQDTPSDHNKTAASPERRKNVPGEDETQAWLAATAARLGLDKPTLVTMFKGALAPTIGLAILQARPIALHFMTLGYLVPIISVLAMCTVPRGKFMMNLVLNLLAICVGSGISMLALWSAVQARHNTTPPESQPAAPGTYNSSQSAVCAVWLFANIWFGNVIRAKLPAFAVPAIIYSILVDVSATFGPFMTTTAAIRVFVQQLLTAMLTGLALATAVNLLVFPVSSRLVVFKDFAGAIGLLRTLVSRQKAYLASLGSGAPSVTTVQNPPSLAKAGGEAHGEDNGSDNGGEAAAARALEETGAKLRELAGKLQADMPFAKRDIAWGKLDAKDLSQMHKLFRRVYIPVLGMNTIIDILNRFAERPDWEASDDDAQDKKEVERHVWNAVMSQVQEPFELLSEAVDQGLAHASICLELVPRPKKATSRAARLGLAARDLDPEAGQEPEPGDRGFARILDDNIHAFYERKGELLRKWVQERGINLDDETSDQVHFRSERDQVQLYIILYMENLMHASVEAVQDLVDFADEKIRDGTMSKTRLIVPTLSRLRKWFVAVLRNDDPSPEQTTEAMDTGSNPVYFNGGYKHKRDPEHLPPETTWQHVGNGVRKISAFFGSEEAAFGFRVACATMTIGIVAFLERTQRFFMEQRLVWAMIIIAIGMSITSGQSFFGFLCRVGGTVVATVLSLVVWYIVDGKAPGVIVFLWISLFINYYFFVKFPRFIPAVTICMVTQAMIIGYGLQVLKIGRAASEQTGQPYYPTYLLAPYRLACVAGGSLVAFFWTVFPYPLTDRTWLRRDLSAILYLLANQFAVIGSTIKSNVNGTAGDVDIPGTPAYQLFKVGRKIFGKTALLLLSSSQHAEWEKWEPTVGGKFPREAYENIIRRCTRIVAYLTLTSYTLMRHPRTDLSDRADDEVRPPRRTHLRGGSLSLHSRSRRASVSTSNREWLSALSDVLDVLKPTHHTILSTLTLLSSSLLSGQSLPPFLPLPRPYEMTRELMRLRRSALSNADAAREADMGDGGPIRMVDSRTGRDDYTTNYRVGDARQDLAVTSILDPRNIEQPGYAEFAVLQVCTTLVCVDLEGLMTDVSGLVGVVDFGFSSDESQSSIDVTGYNGKRKVH